MPCPSGEKPGDGVKGCIACLRKLPIYCVPSVGWGLGFIVALLGSGLLYLGVGVTLGLRREPAVRGPGQGGGGRIPGLLLRSHLHWHHWVALKGLVIDGARFAQAGGRGGRSTAGNRRHGVPGTHQQQELQAGLLGCTVVESKKDASAGGAGAGDWRRRDMSPSTSDKSSSKSQRSKKGKSKSSSTHRSPEASSSANGAVSSTPLAPLAAPIAPLPGTSAGGGGRCEYAS